MCDRFWLEDIRCILSSLQIIPHCGMSEPERLNTMTRLIILVALVMKFMSWGSWFMFLIMGLVIVLILYYTTIPPVRNMMLEHYRPRETERREEDAIHRRRDFEVRPPRQMSRMKILNLRPRNR